MANRRKQEEDWARAQRLCRLNVETMRMARELGLNPRTLIKNIPSRSQPWKAPVHVWIRDLYEKAQARARTRAARKGRERRAQQPVCSDQLDDAPPAESCPTGPPPGHPAHGYVCQPPSDRTPATIPSVDVDMELEEEFDPLGVAYWRDDEPKRRHAPASRRIAGGRDDSIDEIPF